MNIITYLSIACNVLLLRGGTGRTCNIMPNGKLSASWVLDSALTFV